GCGSLRHLPAYRRGRRLGRALLQYSGRQGQLHLFRCRGDGGRDLPVRSHRSGLHAVHVRPACIIPAYGVSMTLKNAPRHHRGDEGFALFMVLLLTLVVGALAMSAISMFGNARLINVQADKQARMEYAALSGTEIA